jgi:release factor glutamine methyltransferase
MVFARELPLSFSEALRVSRQILSSDHDLIRKNAVDAESELIVIGAHRSATGETLSRSELYFRINDRLPEKSAEKVLLFAGMRAQGNLLQHILGWTVFLGHEYTVTPDVLIPRPETEILVSEALAVLNTNSPRLGLEIGLGSGIISIELLSAIPSLSMIASEISQAARVIGNENAKRILGKDCTRLRVIEPESASCVTEPFVNEGIKADFLISNPPYLDPSTDKEVEADVRQYEPSLALFPAAPPGGDFDPLYFYRRIALHSPAILRPGGHAFLEIAAERSRETRAIFDENRWSTSLIRDLTGKERVLIAQLPV